MPQMPKNMNYHSQMILCIVPGGKDASEGNKVAYDNADYLSQKREFAGDGGKSCFVQVTAVFGANSCPELSAQQGALSGERRRVYILGHGDPESSSIGGLKVTQIKAMLETLLNGGKLTRLGLVGCYTGVSQIAPERPMHSLATVLYDKVKGFVDEVVGYTGPVHLSRNLTTYENPNTETVAWTGPDGKKLNISAASVKKNVTQQSNSLGIVLPRKIIVSSTGVTWG